MRVYGARPMDDQGREGAVYRCPVGCGRVVAAGGLAGHVGESVRVEKRSGAATTARAGAGARSSWSEASIGLSSDIGDQCSFPSAARFSVTRVKRESQSRRSKAAGLDTPRSS